MGYGTIAADIITGTNGNSISPESSVFRNRIINGAMTIDQRNAGASGTATGYTVDRWVFGATLSTKGTWQQDAGAVTPPVGFTDYLGFTSNSAYTPLTGDVFSFYQVIEGYNIADLGWGTANAKTVTVSFWVRSSLTGTFGGALSNTTRSNPFSFTINAANTWEYKTVTVAGDTSGTWNSTNGQGIFLFMTFGAGSSFQGTAGTWATADYRTVTGAVNTVGTNGATFYITGVQLEVGSTATSFEYRDYQRELAMCQRYYYKVAPTLGNPFGSCAVQTTSTAEVYVYFPVTLRTTPTALEQSGTANQYAIFTGGGVNASNAVPTFNWASQYVGVPQFNFAAALTVGRAGTAYAATSSGGYLAWSAEL